jgi:hypothetical protein
MKKLAAIGSVDRRGMDPDQQLAGSRHRRRHIAHFDRTG